MPATNETAGASRPTAANQVPVWDLFVRVGHWTLVTLFAVAYVTEDDLMTLHSWAGYGIGLYVVIRIIWGLVGSKHARFKDFLYGPIEAAKYLADLIRFRAKRYLGHSPAGSLMVYALLISLTATTVTGIALLAVKEDAGPLAPWLGNQSSSVEGQRAPSSAAAASGESAADGKRIRREGGGRRRGRRNPLEEVHELIANFTLALIILHVLGVGLASLAHRENLVHAMITGRKRPG